MEPAVQAGKFAWQPLTLRGVAALAGARPGRLLSVQLVVALTTASVVVWFVSHAWFPAVETAIGQLPTSGEIRGGKLRWGDETPKRLVDSHFLAVTVDLDHSAHLRSPAHVTIEFGADDFEVHSLLGLVRENFPLGYVITFNRVELVPWWGAWAPPILAIIFLAVAVGLMSSWAVLACAYFLPAWLVAFFANRELSWGASWRLAGAALMPGALLLSAAIVCYGLGWLDLVQLGAVAAAHFVVGWVYVLASPFRRPLHPSTVGTSGNPFKGP